MVSNSSQQRSQKNPIPRQVPSDKRNNNNNPILITEKDVAESIKRLGSVVRFSFHYLDLEHECFNCGGEDSGWFRSLLETIKEISRLTYYEFSEQRNHYRLHPNDLEKLGYDFKLPSYIQDQIETCLQFSLSKSRGRAHGFFIENTFFIVWLDPDHNLNHDDRFGPMEKYPSIMTPYEVAMEQLQYAQSEMEESKRQTAAMEQWLDEQTSASK